MRSEDEVDRILANIKGSDFAERKMVDVLRAWRHEIEQHTKHLHLKKRKWKNPIYSQILKSK